MLQVPLLADCEDWESTSLLNAPSLPLGQAWLMESGKKFFSGKVRLGWRAETLVLFAQLDDADVFSKATADNQRMWELGDVFEIFLQGDGRSDYTELHVTPNGFTMQLLYPSGEDFLQMCAGSRELSEFVLKERIFRFQVRLVPGGWEILAQIPLSSITPGSHPSRRFQISCSRYDYSSGSEKPVLSSTSAHPSPNFHSQKEWLPIVLQ